MNQTRIQFVARAVIVTVACAGVVAFFRGSYLFGWLWGIAYVVAAVGFLWLFVGLFRFTEKPSPLRAAAIFLSSLPTGYVVAFPVSVSRELRLGRDVGAASEKESYDFRN